MNKGQLFSIDLLFGVILLLFGVGVLIGAAEMNMYNQKEQIIHNELVEKTILGAQVITNAQEWDCNFDNTHAAYSLNTDKFFDAANTIEKIKQKTNLVDYNIRITLGETIAYDDVMTPKNAIAYDLNILTCTNDTNFSMLKNCMTTNSDCYTEFIKKETLRLMVTK